MDEGASVGSESESDGDEDELDRAMERIVARVNNSNPSGNTPATAGGNEMLGLMAMMMKRDKQREKERKEERKLEAERLRQEKEERRQQEKKWESLLTKSGKDGDAGKKRKKDEDWKSEEKELFQASVDIEDDGHEILCWKVRNHLVTPNGKPEDWWKGLPAKRGPMLGCNLVVDHLMPGRVHETTAVKIYDRAEVLELKHLLTKNSGHLGAVKQKVRTDYNASEGSVATSIETDYKACSDVHEAVEGVLNLMVHTYMARPWDYMPMAMVRAGHQMRWFAGVTRNPAEQRSVIERWVNELMVLNSQRARQSKPPPVYEEMLKVARNVCHAANLSERGLMSGDAYGSGGDKDRKIRDLESQIRDLKNANRELRSGRGERDRRDRNDERRDRDGDRKPGNWKITDRKMAETCRNWNTAAGCGDNSCKLKHSCNKVEKDGRLCWGQHKATEHPK